MCYMKALIFIKNNETTERSYHKEFLSEKALALTVQKLLARLKFSKMSQTQA